MAVLNPRVDFAFKKLFGTEENKEILISFINAVVSEQDKVTDVVLLNPYNHKEHSSDKLSILDIKATDQYGRRYNIEMQITDQVFYNQRALYYWAKLYTSQLKKGDNFSDLKKTISINVLNFNYLDGEPDYHSIFKLLSVRTHKSYFEDLELHFIELDKFNNDILHIKTTLERWISFLKKAHHYNKVNFPKELSQEPAIEKAFLSLNEIFLDDEEREIYEARLKWLRDEDATLEKAHHKGLKKGMEQGIKQGIRQGIKQGINQSKEEIALNLMKMGLTVEEVAEATDLSLEELEHL